MLAIIVVNYKNEEQTISYITTELVKVTTPHVIVVVNNSATKKTNQILCEALSAELILNSSQKPTNKGPFVLAHTENLGFAKGNNLGFEFTVTNFKCKYVLFSNNDIKLIELNSVERLINKIDLLPDSVAAIGPAIIGPKGEIQNPIIFLSFFTKWFIGVWVTPFLSKQQRICIYKCDRDNLPEGKYYTLMGSFIIIKTDHFVQCNMFDPNTFLFSEEAILSERLSSIGKSMYYYPEIKIKHDHSLTIKKHNTTRQKMKMMFDSDVYYYKTYRKVSNTTISFCWITLNIYYYLKLLKLKKW